MPEVIYTLKQDYISFIYLIFQIEELQFQIYHLKKENSNLKNENQLQKVKVRKLTEELNKVNKQLDVILDPKKVTTAALYIIIIN